MVAIAQLVEHLIVVQKVARSSRVSHPSQTRTSVRVFRFPSIPPPSHRTPYQTAIRTVSERGRLPAPHADTLEDMLAFENDYSRAAHPAVLEAIAAANDRLYPGYGTDELTARAKERIRRACAMNEADVWFLVGGTQTNQVVIDSMTPAYAGVVAVESGHPNVHEAGAIEYCGHKVLTLPHHNGRMDADELDAYCADFYADGNYEHMVFPGMVYVSLPTEYGTMYTKRELERLAETAHKYDMPLFVDGARLGYGLTATGCDLTLPDLARICDVFYIGGTKVGALFGEAVVFTKNNTPRRFLTRIKQHGALLAKGFALGAQFDALFTDDLYLRIARNANTAADRIREALVAKGYTLTFDTPTNQIFVTLDQPAIERLSKDVRLGFTEKADDAHTVMRICTSWCTTEDEVDRLIALL